MANGTQIANLQQVVKELQSVDRDRLLRPEIGALSLQREMGPKLEILDRRIDLILETAFDIPGNIVESLTRALSTICQYMNEQCERESNEYVAQREEFLFQFQGQFETISKYWPNVIAAAVESRGFLEDEGIKKEFDQAIETMNNESENTIARVKEETEKVIEEARTLAEEIKNRARRTAEEIENRARQTASRISVKAAQEQFLLAQEDHDKQVKLWVWFSGSSISLFLVVALIFLSGDPPSGEMKAMLYFSAVRITIIGALGGMVAFCFRMLRAHMHMAEHNRHRQRVANSIAAFVESAITPEQRDLILAQLVDSIVHFGSSGILRKEDESGHIPKVVVDNLSRTITSPPQIPPRQ